MRWETHGEKVGTRKPKRKGRSWLDIWGTTNRPNPKLGSFTRINHRKCCSDKIEYMTHFLCLVNMKLEPWTLAKSSYSSTPTIGTLALHLWMQFLDSWFNWNGLNSLITNVDTQIQNCIRLSLELLMNFPGRLPINCLRPWSPQSKTSRTWNPLIWLVNQNLEPSLNRM